MIRVKRLRYGYTNQDVLDAGVLLFVAGICLGSAVMFGFALWWC